MVGDLYFFRNGSLLLTIIFVFATHVWIPLFEIFILLYDGFKYLFQGKSYKKNGNTELFT